ncbi:outer membrane liproprotein [Campylobacter iguaniorum]|uniref:hypothetical protein n=1 Tax=Campylobacter iguaniorum TaxID=1244531 RepID=UPI00073A4616|nr:hypothetical protein [Campylobacter iguaniorum]ALV24002.1 outer membrane liproprotein [Campylobacter iguaniorum]
MKSVIWTLLAALFLVGCSSKNGLYIDSGSQKSYETIMTIKTNCKPCDSAAIYKTTINGASYKSDMAISCCENVRKIDTNVALQKVYIHHVWDLRENQKVIYVKNSKTAYTLSSRADAMFYLALRDELMSRGIMVVDSQTSPYTLKVDFAFSDFAGIYNPAYAQLNSKLIGNVSMTNINYKRKRQISTTQNVTGLKNPSLSDFDLYMGLLAKQAANKVAEEISKF